MVPSRSRCERDLIRSACCSCARPRAGLPLAPELKAEAETRFSTGLTHLREGRLELAIEEFKRRSRRTPRTLTSTRASASPTQAEGEAARAERDRRLPQGARAQPLLHRRAQRPRHRAASARASARTGKKEFLTAFSDPTNPTPEMTARNLGQASSRRRTTPRRSTGSVAASTGTRPIRTPSWALADALVAQGSSTRRSSWRGRAAEMPDRRAILLALGEAYYRGRPVLRGAHAARERGAAGPDGPAGRRAAELLKDFPSRPARALPAAPRACSAPCRARSAALLLDAHGEVVVEAGDARGAPPPDRRLQGIALPGLAQPTERYDTRRGSAAWSAATRPARSSCGRSRTATTSCSPSPPRPAAVGLHATLERSARMNARTRSSECALLDR